MVGKGGPVIQEREFIVCVYEQAVSGDSWDSTLMRISEKVCRACFSGSSDV